MENPFVVIAVIGITEFFRRLRVKDWWAALTIVSAAIVGGVAGYFGVEGLTVVSGITAGLAAAGVVTTAQRVSS